MTDGAVGTEAARAQLLKKLAADAPAFEFFQAVRMLARGAGQVGRTKGSGSGPVRFRANLSFQFKASDLQSIRLAAGEGEPPTMAVNFLGVASPGVIGSLPHWYATVVIAEASNRTTPNAAPAEFLAMFDDRLLQLYFRAWLRNNLPIRYELHPQGTVRRLLVSLVGFGTAAVERLFPLDPRALVHQAAAVLRRPTTAAALAASLSAWFGLPFAVQQFAELVQELEFEQRLRLGDAGASLGRTTVLGNFVRVRQSKFRLVVGPVGWDELTGFLPGDAAEQDGRALRELCAWVRQCVGTEFDFDLQVVLREAEVPVLAFRPEDPQRTRLGMAMWLGRRFEPGDAHDTVVDVSGIEQQRARDARRRNPSSVRSSSSRAEAGASPSVPA